MSVTATTSVSEFMALYVESQGRASPDFSSTEESAMFAALAQFQFNATQLDQVDKLLEALEVMRGMVATGTLPASSLDAIEMSILMMLEESTPSPVTATSTTTAASQPLPADVLVFSNVYLTTTYLRDASAWPGADTQLQQDLAPFNLQGLESATATQYLYAIAEQQRYLASVDAAMQAPDGVLYAEPTDPDYPTYLRYQQARDATAAQIDDDVATVQGILAGWISVTTAGFDTVPWSLQLTDPQSAVPPASAIDQAKFELVEDKLLLSQLGSQARLMEGQIAQLSAQLAPRAKPPLTTEQIIQRSTQMTDLKRQLKLIGSEITALQARVAYNTSIAAGAAPDGTKQLVLDLNVDVAQSSLAAYAPTPIDTGPSDPVPTSTLQTQWAADKAAYAALIQDPSPEPPPATPKPTQQLIEGYIGQLSYQLDVPTGMQLTPEQVDELGLLWAHRSALNTQYQAVNAELAALKARMDYAEAVLGGWKPYQASEWDSLSQAVAQATLKREAGEENPPTSGALTTPPAETVAWKLSGADPAHIEITRIENFLLTPTQNDVVYSQLDAFAADVGAVEGDTQSSALARTALQATLSKLTGTSQSVVTQKTNVQAQLTNLDSVIAWLATFEADAATAYDNAESARTVTNADQVDAMLVGVASSTQDMLYDDQMLASLKRDLASSNAYYYANATDAASHTARTPYAQAVYLLASNVYYQKYYTYKAATEPVNRQSYLNSLASYEAAYQPLLTATLARYFDYAYANAPNSSTWPATLSTSMTDAQKAAQVTSHYDGDVYAIIDPIPTTNLS